jgi:hypothetical protein
MTTQLAVPALLAQLSREQLVDTWRTHGPGTQGMSTNTLILVLVAVLVVVLFSLIILRQRQKRVPYMLFFELSGLHAIGRAAERKLLHIARSHRLTDPALVFVCPDLVSELKTLEVSEAKTDRERRKVEEFFAEFTQKVFAGPVA